MSTAMWRRLLAWSGCLSKDPAEMYEEGQGWVTYTYRYTDRALNWFGRSYVRCICCICGAQEDVPLREPSAWLRKPAMVDRGPHPLRQRFLSEHKHPGVNRNPMSWELPLRNPAALQDGDLEDVLIQAANRALRQSAGGQP